MKKMACLWVSVDELEAIPSTRGTTYSTIYIVGPKSPIGCVIVETNRDVDFHCEKKPQGLCSILFKSCDLGDLELQVPVQKTL